ncbi:hypothetical protein GGER_11170 [Serratia rubidaea]
MQHRLRAVGFAFYPIQRDAEFADGALQAGRRVGGGQQIDTAGRSLIQLFLAFQRGGLFGQRGDFWLSSPT